MKKWLKLNIQKTKIMASSPISLWQIDGEAMKTVRDFIFFWGGRGPPKSLQMVTTAMKLNDASWKKSYDQPRQLYCLRHLPTKVHLVKAMVLPVVKYGRESGL